LLVHPFTMAQRQEDMCKPTLNQGENDEVASIASDQSAEPKAVPRKRVSRAKPSTSKYKKAPDAPRRFKSAFIFFSTDKHKEIRAKLGKKGATEKTTNVAKMVSEAWKALSPDERQVWEEKARRDKARYEVEKTLYNGPWKVPANKKTPKDPNAPKRPMSAFLSFSNSKRAAVKRQNPSVSNAEVSRILSRMWRDAPEPDRQKHITQEFKLRQKYKAAMAEWRANEQKQKDAQRAEREDMALKTLDAHKRQMSEGTSNSIIMRDSDAADEMTLLRAMSEARNRAAGGSSQVAAEDDGRDQQLSGGVGGQGNDSDYKQQLGQLAGMTGLGDAQQALYHHAQHGAAAYAPGSSLPMMFDRSSYFRQLQQQQSQPSLQWPPRDLESSLLAHRLGAATGAVGQYGGGQHHPAYADMYASNQHAAAAAAAMEQHHAAVSAAAYGGSAYGGERYGMGSGEQPDASSSQDQQQQQQQHHQHHPHYRGGFFDGGNYEG